MSRPLVELRNLRELESYFREFPVLARQAARIAVNASARYAARLSSKMIREQVAFKRSYIGNAGAPDSKLKARFAQGNDLSASVVARDRPTSLARFALGTPTFGRRTKGQRGPRVRVKTGGSAQTLSGGFFVRLRRGKMITEDQFNIGLAVRVKPGDKLQRSQRAQPLGGGAYLLYGPSVAQVFGTVRADVSPDVGDFAAQEFLRQFRRLSRG